MTVYMIARMNITDPEHFKDYGPKARALFTKHGGRYLGGGDPETLEATTEDRRIAVIEFPDRDAADAYYNDPDYVPVRAIRWKAAQTEIILVDGVGV